MVLGCEREMGTKAWNPKCWGARYRIFAFYHVCEYICMYVKMIKLYMISGKLEIRKKRNKKKLDITHI